MCSEDEVLELRKMILHAADKFKPVTTAGKAKLTHIIAKLFGLEFRDKEDKRRCLEILLDRFSLERVFKAVLCTLATDVGQTAGYITESFSFRVMYASRAAELFRKLGVPFDNFKGMHVLTFFETSQKRSTMTVDNYVRWFLPRFSQKLEIFLSSDNRLLCVLMNPVALMLFRKECLSCAIRERIMVQFVIANKEYHRPTRDFYMLPQIPKKYADCEPYMFL